MIDALSIFLGKLMGLSLFIFGLAMVARIENFQKAIKEISHSDAMMTLISIFPLIAGLSLVISHNIWVKDWSVVITIIGWIILIIGIMRLFFHKEIMKVMAHKYKDKSFFITLGIILMIVGIYLTYMAFYS